MRVIFVHGWSSKLKYCKEQQLGAQININVKDQKINIKGSFISKRDCYLQILWHLWCLFINYLVIKSATLFSFLTSLILIPPLCTYELKCCNLTSMCFVHGFNMRTYGISIALESSFNILKWTSEVDFSNSKTLLLHLL